MSRQDNKYQQPYFINCKRDKCMAWGRVQYCNVEVRDENNVHVKDIDVTGKGCKLIERGR